LVYKFNNIIVIVEKMTKPFLLGKGHVFERMCTESSSDDSDFYVINRSKVGDHVWYVCGEVDARNAKTGKLIEIKMSDPTKIGDVAKHDVWLQSYIVGVDEIRYGVRDPKIRIRDTTSLKVSDLLFSKDCKKMGEKHFCALELVFDKLKMVVKEDTMWFMHLKEESNVVQLYQVDPDKAQQMEATKPPPKCFFDFTSLE
jgi:hypothetical protein